MLPSDRDGGSRGEIEPDLLDPTRPHQPCFPREQTRLRVPELDPVICTEDGDGSPVERERELGDPSRDEEQVRRPDRRAQGVDAGQWRRERLVPAESEEQDALNHLERDTKKSRHDEDVSRARGRRELVGESADAVEDQVELAAVSSRRLDARPGPAGAFLRSLAGGFRDV